ncbi:MAG: ribbon-helix-helix protein, CopG family [Deltaproteobacteria bacterium]|nr:ribbon-helix-helix protein, CopG family [Deltaproteobacteria bacterium]
MKSTLTIRLDKRLEKELDRVCAESGKSRSELVRDALRRQLFLVRLEKLRELTLPYGEAAGFLTDEDVFRRIS